MNLPAILDQHLDDQCTQCERSYRWCECGLPAYFTTDVVVDAEQAVLACERWLLEAPAECPPGPATILRLWAAYRRAEARR
jgi:hypothetical protein